MAIQLFLLLYCHGISSLAVFSPSLPPTFRGSECLPQSCQVQTILLRPQGRFQNSERALLSQLQLLALNFLRPYQVHDRTSLLSIGFRLVLTLVTLMIPPSILCYNHLERG